METNLTAESGTPPFRWQAKHPSFELTAAQAGDVDRRTVRLIGTPGAEQTVAVEVTLTDRCGLSASRTVAFEQRQPPRPPSSLPRACAGYYYRAELEATGSSSEQDTWEIEPSNGLALSGNRVVGTPLQASTQSLRVKLHATGCPAVESDVALTVEERCPLSVPDDAGVRAFPQPCSGQPYVTKLRTSRAFFWRIADPRPAGASLDVELKGATTQGLLSGTGGSEEDALVLQLESSGDPKLVYRVGFALQPRSSCWLAYIPEASEGNAGRLVLVDPPLHTPEQDTTQVFPKSVAAAALDFAFSPDGRWLLYRAQEAGSPRHLRLIQMESLSERELPDFGARDVVAYAWSQDSRHVALVTSDASEARLEGFTLLSDGSSGQGVIQPAAGVGAPSNTTAVSWFASTELVLTVSGEQASAYLFFSALSKSAFSGPRLTRSYSTPPLLYPSPAGLFVLPQNANSLQHFTSNGPNDAETSRPNAVLSPSRNMLAQENDGRASLSRVASGAPGGLASIGEVNDCPKLLAWSQQEERIACVKDVPNSPSSKGELRVFDADAETTLSRVVALGSNAAADSNLTQALASTARRTWSPNGEWFAYRTSNRVNVVRWGERPNLVYSGARPDSDATRTLLSFSPNGKVLVEVTASRAEPTLALGVVLGLKPSDAESTDLPTHPELIELVVPNSAIPALSCDDLFWRSPRNWCGNNPDTSSVDWAREAAVLAVRGGDGAFVISDLARAPAMLRDVKLSDKRSRQLRFQP